MQSHDEQHHRFDLILIQKFHNKFQSDYTH